MQDFNETTYLHTQMFKPAHSSSRQLHVIMQYSCFLQGLGTDDQDLIRIIVSRCEVDLVDIKLEFQRKYHKSLGSFIKVINDHYLMICCWLTSVSHIPTNSNSL